MAALAAQWRQPSTDAGKTRTENGLGAVSHEGVGDSRVVLSYSLVRGLDKCADMVDRVLEDARAFGGLEWLVDLLVMTVQTRDCREGKGERELAWQMLMRLSTVLPKSTAALLRLLPKTFGSWKDVRTLYALASTKDDKTETPRDPALAQLCVSMFKEQLAKDIDTLANGDKKDVSLCAKWAPREGSANSAMAKVLGNAIFEQEKDARKQYRHMVAKLNKSLETVEVKMCSKRFREIAPAAVPAAALKRYRNAFIDVKKHADDEDRLACARNFKMHAMDANAKMHGGTLFPHELVVECEKNRKDEISLEIIQKQWEDLIRQVQTPMDTGAEDETVMAVDEVGEVVEADPKEKKEIVTPLGGKYVPLVDVSGSMSGTPMDVAVSMGILMSEIAHPAFKDRFISFNSTPTWIQLPAGGKLHEKVTVAKRSPWGMSTNFLAAIELILDSAKKGEVAREDMPQALFVFSDMQFDQARDGSFGNWDTGYEMLDKKFVEAGYGHAPMCVFWNLRSGSSNMPVRSDQKGVVTCSGYSPSLLKYFMEKDLVKDMEEREQALKREEEAKEAIERAAEEVAKLKKEAAAKAEVVAEVAAAQKATMEEGEQEGEECWVDVVNVAVEQVQVLQDLDEKLANAERVLEEAKVKQSVAALDAEATGMTPTAMMRSMLDHERYTCVRELPDANQEIGMELECFLSSTTEIA